MSPGEAADREAIRDLAARYAVYADTGRFEEIAALFAVDGSLEIEGRPPCAGREAVTAFLEASKAELAEGGVPARIRHHVSSVVIDFDGPNAARMIAYFLVVAPHGPDHWGRYHDDVRREEGRWYFTRRRVRVEGRFTKASIPG